MKEEGELIGVVGLRSTLLCSDLLYSGSFGDVGNKDKRLDLLRSALISVGEASTMAVTLAT